VSIIYGLATNVGKRSVLLDLSQTTDDAADDAAVHRASDGGDGAPSGSRAAFEALVWRTRFKSAPPSLLL
jgi:hypothetical protein